jgi:hypothetical protein
MDHLFEVIANLIIDGLYKFSQVVAKLKAGVAKKLKEKGREDLATDSDAKKEDK